MWLESSEDRKVRRSGLERVAERKEGGEVFGERCGWENRAKEGVVLQEKQECWDWDRK